eukprot:Skav221423  [mRNA]  locus=scaffold1064:262521:263041:+ [translate_table: standard]
MPEQKGTFPEQSVVITLEGMNVRITNDAWVLPRLLLRNPCWIDGLESRVKWAEVEIRLIQLRGVCGKNWTRSFGHHLVPLADTGITKDQLCIELIFRIADECEVNARNTAFVHQLLNLARQMSHRRLPATPAASGKTV